MLITLEALRWLHSFVTAHALAVTIVTAAGLLALPALMRSSKRGLVASVVFALAIVVSGQKPETNAPPDGASPPLMACPPCALSAGEDEPAATDLLRFTAFSVSSGYLNYALEWPATVLPAGGVLDVYGTRDLVAGLWSVVDTFSTAGVQTYSNSLPVTAGPAGFLFADDRTDADGDGYSDVWSGRLHLLDSDGDGTPDVEEAGCVEPLPDEDFIWFDVSDSWNGLAGGNYWTGLSSDSLLGGVRRGFAQHCLDGFLNLVPDVNWTQGQISSWSGSDSLFTTDYSCGGVTVMAFPGDFTGIVALGSGLFMDTVTAAGRTYDVFEWKDVWPSSEPSATAPRATFEVILPLDEPDAVYVSYLSVDDGFPGAGRRFGVQDASRRAAADPTRFYMVSRLGTADFPRSGQTVRYTLGLNTAPDVGDGYVEPVLPSSANTNAYYTVRVHATAGAALVTFTGDGPSDLPDPGFLLPAGGDVCVTLLKGKGYVVSASAPVEVSGPSDPAAEILRTDADGRAWSVERPLALSLHDEADGSATVVSDASAWGGTFSWAGGLCRPQIEADGTWRLRCTACGCGRCEITGTCAWEGYVRTVSLGYCRCQPEGDDAETEIRCPDTLFNNDDSDRVSNRVDSVLGASTAPDDDPLADDDVVPVTVTFGVSDARGSALISAAGGKLRFWDSKEKRNEVSLPMCIDDVELPHTVELWMEATDVSTGYEDQSISLFWQTASGRHSGSLEKKITSVETVVIL